MPARRALLVAALLAATTALAACDSHPPTWQVPAADPATVRTIAQGPVEGGLGRYESHAWLGIPFAAPPVGPLRWRAPQPPAPWNLNSALVPRQALHFSASCPQFASALGGVEGKAGSIVGSEDCLYLNVWAPRFATAEVPKAADRLPVMVWIHGGGNSIGSTHLYDGGRLASEQKVIVVSTQYRLGPLGWFRHKAIRAGETDPGALSGNFGTLDLIAALKWVRENIAAFGGDPGNVTIFGESAGGLDVYSLLLAPAANGLFAHAISESGGLSSTTAQDAEAGRTNSSREVLLRLLQRDGLAKDRAGAKTRLDAMSDGEVAALLRKKTANEILSLYGGPRGMIDMPLVIADGETLPAAPWLDAFKQGKWNRVPVILGTNHDEVKLFMALDPKRVHRKLGLFPRYLDETNYQATAEWESRAWKVVAAGEPASAMVASGFPKVWLYRFDWHDEPTLFGADLSKMLGAAHGFEIPFVFGHFELGSGGKLLFPEKKRAAAEWLSSAMRSYWGEFARSGNPNHGGSIPWDAWGEQPTVLDLDVASAGGIRMTTDTDGRATIINGIDHDPRFKNQQEKCHVYRSLTGFVGLIERKDYPHAGSAGCEAFPLDPQPND